MTSNKAHKQVHVGASRQLDLLASQSGGHIMPRSDGTAEAECDPPQEVADTRHCFRFHFPALTGATNSGLCHAAGRTLVPNIQRADEAADRAVGRLSEHFRAGPGPAGIGVPRTCSKRSVRQCWQRQRRSDSEFSARSQAWTILKAARSIGSESYPSADSQVYALQLQPMYDYEFFGAANPLRLDEACA